MTFGPDGVLYVSKVGFGQPPVGLGQIVRVTVPKAPDCKRNEPLYDLDED
jgi:hypothetical protein